MRAFRIAVYCIVIAAIAASITSAWIASATFGSVMTVLWVLLVAVLTIDYLDDKEKE